MKKLNNRILLSGGGTGGSVTPLIALVEELRHANADFEYLWVGSKSGIEVEMVEEAVIPYFAIANGKLRRYFSFKNFIDPFFIGLAFFQSIALIWKWQPSILVSAGSFVAVPLTWAAWVLRVPIVVHQMDVRPGLANKLMAPFAKTVTVTFEKSLNDYGKKAKLVGNPVRTEIKKVKQLDRAAAISRFGFKSDLPILLVVGGGTGAESINKLVLEALPELSLFCRVIHQTGEGKSKAPDTPRYRPMDFLDTTTLTEAFRAADVVISRAGLGFITEVCYLEKPTIIIPMPNSHQEDNAEILASSNAAIVLRQDELSGEILSKVVKKLLDDQPLKAELAKNMSKVILPDAEKLMASVITEILAKN